MAEGTPMNMYPKFLSGGFAARISNYRATYLSAEVGEVFLQTFVFYGLPLLIVYL